MKSSRKLSEINEIVHKGNMKSSKRLKFDDAAIAGNAVTTSQCIEVQTVTSSSVQDKNSIENSPKNTYKATALENRLADLGMLYIGFINIA